MERILGQFRSNWSQSVDNIHNPSILSKRKDSLILKFYCIKFSFSASSVKAPFSIPVKVRK